MTTTDLTNNRDRIIRTIKGKITACTSQNIKDVMVKMVAILPQFENEKATMKNIDAITFKATNLYTKYYKVNTAEQNSLIEDHIELNKLQSRQSSLR
ncbi:hypothetical protein [Elizabethkingia anophelis]|uniref:hypothetical protein n=1 Tax=Elizabethkingia anophelis TaxID=1117645 RepID=UPI0038916F03